VGEKRKWAVLVVATLGCGSTSGNNGSVGAAGSPGEMQPPDESKLRTWTACGTIPSTVVSGLLPEYQPGEPIVGGHPYSPDLDASSRITALAMSADGLTLVSMGGMTLVWDVAPVFADSRATYVDHGSPEWPQLDISPDGRWITIFGDGRRVLSRDGVRGPWLAGLLGSGAQCWPAEARFSPDGTWLVGASFGPGIDVFRVADLDGPAETELQPFVSLPAPCGPGAFLPETFGSTTRVAFTPDGQLLVTETGARYRTSDWQLESEPQGQPTSHGYNGALTVSVEGTPLLSDCTYNSTSHGQDCTPQGGRFPVFSSDGRWLLAGGTLTHVPSGETRVLDATAPVGIVAPNGDVIAAARDNSLTRYCLGELPE
jgi:hypothetical protein